MRFKLGALVMMALLLAQPAAAATYPVTIPFGRSWPFSIVVDSARGFAYIDATSGDYPPTGFSFGVINATSHALVKVLGLGEVPGPMALDQTTGNVYVAGLNSIAVFDGKNQAFDPPIDVGRPILSIAHDGSVSPDIFVTSGNQVLAIDPGTGTSVWNATLENSAGGLALDPANGRLFVSQYPSGAISVFQASDLSPVGKITLPSCCASQFALDPRTQTLYATSGTNGVFIINAVKDAFEKTVQVAPFAQNETNVIVADNDTGRVYVSVSPGGTIVELNGASGAVVGSLKVGSQPVGLAIDTKTHELYATNYHQITVFDASRARPFLLLLVLGGAVVAVGIAVVVLVIRRSEARERMKIQEAASRGEEARPEVRP
jgi:DNA-binding beta-propeller fold protein YncE